MPHGPGANTTRGRAAPAPGVRHRRGWLTAAGAYLALGCGAAAAGESVTEALEKELFSDAKRVTFPLHIPGMISLEGTGSGALVRLTGEKELDLQYDEKRNRVFKWGDGRRVFRRRPIAIPGAQDAYWRWRDADCGMEASLRGPTDRYAHGVFGQAVEASRIEVKFTTVFETYIPETHDRCRALDGTVEAGADAVFEDRRIRLFRVEAQPFLLVVRSTLRRGAALAVLGHREGAWKIIAETPPLGGPNRWLNPAGIADFDGDGTPDVALVRQPHAVGMLELWSWRGGALVKVAERGGYANHAYGSAAQGLSAVVDAPGGPLLALPSFDRRALALVSFRGGEVVERARFPLPARVLTGVAAVGRGVGARLLVGLEDGRVVEVRPGGARP